MRKRQPLTLSVALSAALAGCLAGPTDAVEDEALAQAPRIALSVPPGRYLGPDGTPEQPTIHEVALTPCSVTIKSTTQTIQAQYSVLVDEPLPPVFATGVLVDAPARNVLLLLRADPTTPPDEARPTFLRLLWVPPAAIDPLNPDAPRSPAENTLAVATELQEPPVLGVLKRVDEPFVDAGCPTTSVDPLAQ